MLPEQEEDTTTYKVVINHEEQYSLWPADRENAPGWRDTGKEGPKAECLAFIEEVWTDMRPLSLRKQMEARGKKTATGAPSAAGESNDIDRDEPRKSTAPDASERRETAAPIAEVPATKSRRGGRR
jgi:MbtH protein